MDEQLPADDFAGYPSLEQLVNGYRASSEEGKRQRERADALELNNAALMEMLREQQAPRQDVPNRPNRPEDRLTDLGVDATAVSELVDSRVQQAFAPIARGLEARKEMIRRHADYLKYEQEVANWINADPQMSAEYNEAFQRDPVLAMENAMLKYGQHRWSAFQAALPQGKVDASIPTSRAGDTRRGPGPDGELQQALERFQRTGTPAAAHAYAKARLRGVVSDEFLNQ